MTGRHRAVADAKTEPMSALTPPRDPSPETATMPAIRPDQSEWDAWAQFQKGDDPDAYMAPLRTGGSRVEARLRQTMRERGLILAKRVGRKALRLRAALAKGGRR
ncbi:hypothetical protein ACGF0J_21705 [Nonomuraea sp. NPDC047897]|uniref:hypothetical protein n=1 Tax=Nonomuraea sp. NPDC047897 TaxID=3364346 RepID=UPI00371840B7